MLYDVLSHLKLLGPALTQALRQLADALTDSLTEYDVYEDDGSDPRANVARCRTYLGDAESSASHLGAAIGDAQELMARQSYRTSNC